MGTEPTLYADDLDYLDSAVVDTLKRILPIRCPHPKCDDGKVTVGAPCPDDLNRSNADGPQVSCGVYHLETVDHDTCEGRGWLFPDMPDWWYEPADCERETPWKAFCKDMWRAMGIWEGTE